MNEQTQNTTPAAEPRKGFVFYLHWAECMEDLRPMERAAVYDALIQYAKTGETPTLQGRCKMAFKFIQGEFERTDAVYQRRKQGNSKGGSNHKGNQYTRKMEVNGSQWKSMEVDGSKREEKISEVKEKIKEDKEKVGRAKASPESAATAATTDRRKVSFYDSLKPYTANMPAAMLRSFFDYWSEPTPDGTKMRYELERTWSLPHRLRAWQSREPAKARASPNAGAQQREQEAAERERQYQQRMAREEAEREARLAEQRSKAVFDEELFARMKARFDK